jgi:hypothetical protein
MHAPRKSRAGAQGAGGRVGIEQDHFAGLKDLAEMYENRLKSGYLSRNMGRF